MPRKNRAAVIAVVAVVVLLALVYLFTQPAADARVLLVASDVIAQAGGAAQFERYLVGGSVAVVEYDYERAATYAELGGLINAHMDAKGASRALSVRSVRSVGIVYHTPNRYSLKCFASDGEKSTVLGAVHVDAFEPFRRFVVALRAVYGVEEIDLISCDVVSAERSVFSVLDFGGARVNASTNATGQAKQGPVGDWVLESGNVRLIGRYFNATIATADLALKRPMTTPRPTTMTVYFQCAVDDKCLAAYKKVFNFDISTVAKLRENLEKLPEFQQYRAIMRVLAAGLRQPEVTKWPDEASAREALKRQWTTKLPISVTAMYRQTYAGEQRMFELRSEEDTRELEKSVERWSQHNPWKGPGPREITMDTLRRLHARMHG
jgi:hypothetical protein